MMYNNHNIFSMKTLCFIACLICLTLPANSQDTDKMNPDTLQKYTDLSEVSDTISGLNFFDTDEPLKITLKYDITSFIRNKHEGEYLDAVLEIYPNKQDTIVKNIRLKARGNFRRGECYFPPLYLNFKTDPVKNTELQGVKKIKVVTHCVHSKASQIYILREFLAYKMYNVLTPLSFKVRLLDIQYIDTGKRQKNYQETGFVIEPLDLVAKRNNSVVIDPKLVKGENIKEESADQVALFEYMIGNTDWMFRSGHNIRYLKSLDEFTGKVVAVPYDFDFSGFVNTNYSFPQEWAGVDHVLKREFLGLCRNNDNSYRKTIDLFIEKKEEIIEIINSSPFIDEKEKKNLISYINEFNARLSKPENFVATLKRECRTNF